MSTVLKWTTSLIFWCKKGVDGMNDIDIGQIKFDEVFYNDTFGTVTLYYKAPKELLKEALEEEEYETVVSSEISMEFPKDHIEPEYADICISPTRETDGCLEDYEWFDITFPFDEIQALIDLVGDKAKGGE